MFRGYINPDNSKPGLRTNQAKVGQNETNYCNCCDLKFDSYYLLMIHCSGTSHKLKLNEIAQRVATYEVNEALSSATPGAGLFPTPSAGSRPAVQRPNILTTQLQQMTKQRKEMEVYDLLQQELQSQLQMKIQKQIQELAALQASKTSKPSTGLSLDDLVTNSSWLASQLKDKAASATEAATLAGVAGLQGNNQRLTRFDPNYQKNDKTARVSPRRDRSSPRREPDDRFSRNHDAARRDGDSSMRSRDRSPRRDRESPRRDRNYHTGGRDSWNSNKRQESPRRRRELSPRDDRGRSPQRRDVSTRDLDVTARGDRDLSAHGDRDLSTRGDRDLSTRGDRDLSTRGDCDLSMRDRDFATRDRDEPKNQETLEKFGDWMQKARQALMNKSSAVTKPSSDTSSKVTPLLDIDLSLRDSSVSNMSSDPFGKIQTSYNQNKDLITDAINRGVTFDYNTSSRRDPGPNFGVAPSQQASVNPGPTFSVPPSQHASINSGFGVPPPQQHTSVNQSYNVAQNLGYNDSTGGQISSRFDDAKPVRTGYVTEKWQQHIQGVLDRERLENGEPQIDYGLSATAAFSSEITRSSLDGSGWNRVNSSTSNSAFIAASKPSFGADNTAFAAAANQQSFGADGIKSFDGSNWNRMDSKASNTAFTAPSQQQSFGADGIKSFDGSSWNKSEAAVSNPNFVAAANQPSFGADGRGDFVPQYRLGIDNENKIGKDNGVQGSNLPTKNRGELLTEACDMIKSSGILQSNPSGTKDMLKGKILDLLTQLESKRKSQAVAAAAPPLAVQPLIPPASSLEVSLENVTEKRGRLNLVGQKRGPDTQENVEVKGALSLAEKNRINEELFDGYADLEKITRRQPAQPKETFQSSNQKPSEDRDDRVLSQGRGDVGYVDNRNAVPVVESMSATMYERDSYSEYNRPSQDRMLHNADVVDQRRFAADHDERQPYVSAVKQGVVATTKRIPSLLEPLNYNPDTYRHVPAASSLPDVYQAPIAPVEPVKRSVGLLGDAPSLIPPVNEKTEPRPAPVKRTLLPLPGESGEKKALLPIPKHLPEPVQNYPRADPYNDARSGFNQSEPDYLNPAGREGYRSGGGFELCGPFGYVDEDRRETRDHRILLPDPDVDDRVLGRGDNTSTHWSATVGRPMDTDERIHQGWGVAGYNNSTTIEGNMSFGSLRDKEKFSSKEMFNEGNRDIRTIGGHGDSSVRKSVEKKGPTPLDNLTKYLDAVVLTKILSGKLPIELLMTMAESIPVHLIKEAIAYIQDSNVAPETLVESLMSKSTTKHGGETDESNKRESGKRKPALLSAPESSPIIIDEDNDEVPNKRGRSPGKPSTNQSYPGRSDDRRGQRSVFDTFKTESSFERRKSPGSKRDVDLRVSNSANENSARTSLPLTGKTSSDRSSYSGSAARGGATKEESQGRAPSNQNSAVASSHGPDKMVRDQVRIPGICDSEMTKKKADNCVAKTEKGVNQNSQNKREENSKEDGARDSVLTDMSTPELISMLSAALGQLLVQLFQGENKTGKHDGSNMSKLSVDDRLTVRAISSISQQNNRTLIIDILDKFRTAVGSDLRRLLEHLDLEQLSVSLAEKEEYAPLSRVVVKLIPVMLQGASAWDGQEGDPYNVTGGNAPDDSNREEGGEEGGMVSILGTLKPGDMDSKGRFRGSSSQTGSRGGGRGAGGRGAASGRGGESRGRGGQHTRRNDINKYSRN